MKRKILFSLVLMIMFAGVMIITDNVKASDIESLQPAEQIVYSETLYVPSVHIGGTGGEGGVTYFNGSIVNASEGDVPVTFGDDVRIDGMLWRGPSKGTSDGQPLKIADTLMPALDNINDIGTENNQWRNIYYRDTLQGGSAHVGELTADTGRIANELLVNDYISVGGGYGQTGTTLDANGNIQLDGDIQQRRGMSGAAKAMVRVNSDGTCERSWTFNGTPVTCERQGTLPAGSYLVSFQFNVEDRYWQITPVGVPYAHGARGFTYPSDNQVTIRTYGESQTNPIDSDFDFIVF